MSVRWVVDRGLVFLLVLLISCGKKPQQDSGNYYESEFFRQVQLSSIFEDSKTFVDCVPKHPLVEIVTDYNQGKPQGKNLEAFVLANFEVPVSRGNSFASDTSRSMSAHIHSLWPVLSQQADKYQPNSSQIPLPNPYVVPGGRFREIYYWDSYFTMLGLNLSGHEDMTRNMVDNFSFLIDSLGFIPNGNRAYYSGRSQPPFFSLMVSLIASKDRSVFMHYLDAMVKEYQFWMRGSQRLNHGNVAVDRVVLLPDSSILNRYWDQYDQPRPESYKEDYELVHSNRLDASTTYRHLRAGAESGWDYSSRWFADHKNISTIHTTDIIPVDLNCLIYHLEVMISQGYNWQGDIDKSREFLLKADRRKRAIHKYLWDDGSGFFVDYDFRAGQPTGVLSLAGAFPLYFRIASKPQARSVRGILEQQFLKPGGFVSTLKLTGQQWDAPNGWAPLQWITINGLYNYGHFELGNSAAERWLDRNRRVYKATGKMMEKYNVEDTALLAGGGEYPLQDGFGWTNGVALALEKIMNDKVRIKEMTTTE